MAKARDQRQIIGLFLLILVQVICAIMFMADVISDVSAEGGLRYMDSHLMVELVASLTLFLAIYIEARLMLIMRQRQKQSERSMRVASGAFQQVINDYFTSWGLSPAECDVAGFLIKGYSITEISKFRKSAEGTIKTQLNAVYRKAGVSGRSQLVSLLIEDLLAEPLC